MPLFDVAFHAFDPARLIGAPGSGFVWQRPPAPAGTTPDAGSARGLTLNATVVWPVRDNATGQTFRVARFDVRHGGASCPCTVSERPLVAGRRYTVIGRNPHPDVTDPDIAVTHADRIAAFAAAAVAGTGVAGTGAAGTAVAGTGGKPRADTHAVNAWPVKGITGVTDRGGVSLASTCNSQAVVCFAAGTRILTPQGLRAIETLRVGDAVWTADSGARPIRWIGQRNVAAEGRHAPVRFAPGTLGNENALIVSPQHRMMLGGWQVQVHFATCEALVAARHLVDGRNITRVEGGEVSYLHLLFDRHEIVFAEGVASESFHPDPIGLENLEAPAREELFGLYPCLRSDPAAFGPAARPTLSAREAQLLAA